MKIEFRTSEIEALINLTEDESQRIRKEIKQGHYRAAATAARNMAIWANTLAVILSEYNHQY